MKLKNLIGPSPFLLFQTLVSKISFRRMILARLYVLSLSEPRIENLRGFGVIREGLLTDIDGMCRLEDKRDIFLERFSQGESCIVATAEGQIVGYCWFSDKRFHLEDRFNYRLDIPEDSIFAFDGFIKKQFRTRGIFVLLQKELLEKRERFGRKKIMVTVDFGNDPSLKTHLRFGYTAINRISLLRCFKINFVRIKNISYKLSDLKKVLSA